MELLPGGVHRNSLIFFTTLLRQFNAPFPAHQPNVSARLGDLGMTSHRIFHFGEHCITIMARLLGCPRRPSVRTAHALGYATENLLIVGSPALGESPLMENVSRTAIEALEGTRACLFVHFDFEFFPMRVHSGHGLIDWEGHKWQGVGDVLRLGASSSWSVLSSRTNERGRMSASLPMNKEMQEILSEEYYRDREMRWMVCAMDATGGVDRRVSINRGRIIDYKRSEDTVLFSAKCEFLDSLRDLDARHKRKVSAIRKRFQNGLVETIVSSGAGWAVSLAEAIADPIGLFVDILETVLPGRNQRILKQRWSARRRTYRFRTEPRIPGMRLWRKGYRVRADTLNEAKSKLYERAARKVWDIPPSFINMVIYWDDRPLEFLNLDKIRQNDDPKRYEETSPMRGWPP